MKVTLSRIDDVTHNRTVLAEFKTNNDGRTGKALEGESFTPGRYEWTFFTGERAKGQMTASVPACLTRLLGRPVAPPYIGDSLRLVLAGPYFAKAGLPTDGMPFLDEVPIRFGIDNPEEHYHVRAGKGAV